MASCCRAALVCLVVIMVCTVFPRVQADLMETSTAHDIKITVSKQESETEKNFHVENVTSADFSELSPRQDDPDAVEQPEEKPKGKPKGKAKQDPYTKSVLGALDSMRTDFTNFNLGEFMKVVNDKKLLKKPDTTTSKPVQVADGQQGAVPVKATAAPAQVNGDNGQDGAVQVPETVDEGRDTQETVDGPQPENAGSPYTKNLMTELDSMHRGSLKFDLGKLFTAINKDKEFQKGSTVKRTIDNGGNSTSDCACKTSSGVCHPVDAKQCLLHNGARIVKCEASGKWMPVEECKKTCEWSAGKLPVCVN